MKQKIIIYFKKSIARHYVDKQLYDRAYILM